MPALAGVSGLAGEMPGPDGMPGAAGGMPEPAAMPGPAGGTPEPDAVPGPMDEMPEPDVVPGPMVGTSGLAGGALAQALAGGSHPAKLDACPARERIAVPPPSRLAAMPRPDEMEGPVVHCLSAAPLEGLYRLAPGLAAARRLPEQLRARRRRARFAPPQRDPDPDALAFPSRPDRGGSAPAAV